MKTLHWKKMAAVLAVGLCAHNPIEVARAALPQPPILNVSTDLDRLPGDYKASNMIPNSAQDSAPLLNDAIRWVSHYNRENPDTPYTTIKAKRGVYYFLSTTKVGGRDVFVVVQPENGNDRFKYVTIDLDGSDLFFSQAEDEAFMISGCRNLTLESFSIDYATLPFTQLVVLGIVNSNQITVTPESVAPSQTPWVDVYQLSQTQARAALYGFDFRNGRPQYTSGRLTIQLQTGPSSTLTLQQGDTSLIQVGDVFEVEARGGGPAVSVDTSSNISLKNIAIYSSGGVGIITNYSPGVSIQNVSIVPRPGTNRLVSTNAGGIAVNQTAANNTIVNCTIAGTQDDSISGNSSALGYSRDAVPAGATAVTLAQPMSSLVMPGINVYFVDPSTVMPIRESNSDELVIRTVVSVVPSGTGLVVTMKRGLPELPAFAMMYNVEPGTRGKGLLIDSNSISYNTLARGIALSGQTGVTISHNRIVSTEEAGILCATDYGTDPHLDGGYWTFGPVSNLRIDRNVLIAADSGTGPGLGLSELAAIQLVVTNLQDEPVSSPVCPDVIITNNRIVNTPRTGIWIMNAQRGLVEGNTLTNTGYDPTLQAPSHIPSSYNITGNQAMIDFETPLLIQSSKVIVGKNPVN
ncbi:MAG: right-handed parallel beta-helix repeat-containing protein [Verrucomicrobia bacterium]|nr:right-handed parallel beta-helix repeat-containing protein [Verrucomicrobiota bacterium]